MKRILITGGAGFVGANLAILFKQSFENTHIICFDNLSRKGSHLNLPRLAAHGIEFIHGDVRNKDDLFQLSTVDWLIECSAEPSVHAGFNENPSYLVNTNLNGLIHCLEFLREKGGKLVFLSTSRVYPIAPLRALPLTRVGNRFQLSDVAINGVHAGGIHESFTLHGTRSLYGATKLCAELLIAEYQAMYHLDAVINRCGVLTGPWQMGKVDQGFMALWVAMHYFQQPLKYMGFGGEGLQVRDVLHVSDLFALLQKQMKSPKMGVWNVGGGLTNSVSLNELTELVQESVNKTTTIGRVLETRDADIPYYVTDNTQIMQDYGWKPTLSVPAIVDDMAAWLRQNENELKNIFVL